MSQYQIETAQVRRYVAAIERLRTHEDTSVRMYAHSMLRDVIEFSTSEILGPIINSPMVSLSKMERLLRLTVEAMQREALAKARD